MTRVTGLKGKNSLNLEGDTVEIREGIQYSSINCRKTSNSKNRCGQFRYSQLLSRMTMKQAGVKMDLEHDRAEIFGQDVALNLTSSGHYCIPIDKTEKIPVETVCAVNFDDIGENERYKILLKLHRQFAHPSKRRLVALLKDAGVWKDDYLEV